MIARIDLFPSVEGGEMHFPAISFKILDIIYRPVFCLNHNVSENGFCLRLQVEPTQFGLINKARLCLQSRSGDRNYLYLLVPPEDGDRTQSTKRCGLNKR
jgi:hypothetical protein